MSPLHQALSSLAELDGFPCVSILFANDPTDPRQGFASRRWLLRRAEDQLASAGIAGREAQDLLDPLAEGGTWSASARGVALYRWRTGSRGGWRDGSQYLELPVALDEIAVVGSHAHIAALLPALSTEDWFYILAASLHQVRLFEASGETIHLLPTPELPAQLTDVVGTDWKDSNTQMRTGVAGPKRGGGVFHGHGGRADDAKEEVARFVQRIDHGLSPYLERGSAPLVVAAVDYIGAMFKSGAHGKRIVGVVAGSPDGIDERVLLERSRDFACAVFRRRVDQATARCRESMGGERASADLAQILAAGFEGRIELLLVEGGRSVWGAYDRLNRVVDPAPPAGQSAEELVNLAVLLCLRTGGTAYDVAAGSLPDRQPAAALFRY